MRDFGLSREVKVEKGKTALLFIDVQKHSAPGGGGYAGLSAEEIEATYGYFLAEMRARAVPNMQRLQRAARAAKVEVMYTVIEALTQDGRDLSLDYKISRIFCAKGSRDAEMLDEIAPEGDEIVIPKTSSSVFISTNIHYVLGNLGVKYLIVAGVLTDQCIDSAVRDACDLGYLVSLVTDACASLSKARQESALANNRGYCRQVTTAAMCEELEGLG
ncbi:MAG TPA: isochorismatase family cysteine hydrolase [Acetobacteraceae bacterium]|nr:isochorismatase family cysteine hydrolase [Acetobacteraceae bacterium]